MKLFQSQSASGLCLGLLAFSFGLYGCSKPAAKPVAKPSTTSTTPNDYSTTPPTVLTPDPFAAPDPSKPEATGTPAKPIIEGPKIEGIETPKIEGPKIEGPKIEGPKIDSPTTPKPTDKPKTGETPKPTDTPKSSDKPSDTPKPEETTKPEAKPNDAPKPNDSGAAANGDVPKVAARPVVPSANENELTLTWNQWGGSSARNNTPNAKNLPTDWKIGEFDDDTGEWKKENAKNIKWVAKLGSQSYGNPVIADGKVFVGTNNGGGYLKRYPSNVDLGCLLAFSEADGKFLWQHSSEKLPSGRVHDWPMQGICSASYVEGKQLWFVTSRGEVLCLDTEGFRDGKNNGPFQSEKVQAEDEADVIWSLDMMHELGVSQHNMCNCSITCTGNILWVCTSNGVDESHINLPAPKAPSFIAVDKNDGKVIWADASPGNNILHGEWSSPAYAVLGGVPQVIFAGGDAWMYSFQGEATSDGKAKLLWEFDANPKTSKYILGGRGTRNEVICTPVVYKNKVYLAVGQDPEHSTGIGHLWCVDPTKRGDVSAELAFSLSDPKTPLPKRRLQAVDEKNGEVARPNPNSAVVWHYDGCKTKDLDASGKIGDYGEEWGRTCGTPAIKDDLLFIVDLSGLVLCIDAETGEPYWTHDTLAETWSTPLIADGKVYIGNTNGNMMIFRCSKTKEVFSEDKDNGVAMGAPVHSTAVVANNVMYIASDTHLFAIQNTGK